MVKRGIYVIDDVDKQINEKTPVVILMAGLTGGTHDIYIASAMKECFKYKYKSVLLNHRGCSNTSLSVRNKINNKVVQILLWGKYK